jgi:hypothetical protein
VNGLTSVGQRPASTALAHSRQLQPFGIKFGRHHREPGDVFPGMRQALDQTGPHRIEDESIVIKIFDVARLVASVPTVLSWTITSTLF